MRMKWLLPLLIFTSSLFSLAESNYRITYDINMSPYAGGNDLLYGTRLIEHGFSFLEEKTNSISFLSKIVRLIDLTLIYLPINYFASTVEHEVFGHGYRIRDIQHGIASVAGYEFTFPPPYGPGNASTSFYINPEEISTTDLSSISIAGFEAQSILAGITKFTWLESKRIDPRQAVLYLVSQFGINLYATGVGLDANELQGHDLFDYITPLNLTYTSSNLTESRIRALSWINLADPFVYFSIYSWFRYIITGKETKIPMIPIDDWGYLFGARLGLTPFGPEIFIDNYLLKNCRPIYFYAKAGHHSQNTYVGAGFYAPYFVKKDRVTFGARFDAWRQPKLLLQSGVVPLTEIDFREPPEIPLYSSHEQHQMRFGAAASFICSYQKNRALGFEAELGYKSPGFLPGYSLRAAPTLRVSLQTLF